VHFQSTARELPQETWCRRHKLRDALRAQEFVADATRGRAALQGTRERADAASNGCHRVFHRQGDSLGVWPASNAINTQIAHWNRKPSTSKIAFISESDTPSVCQSGKTAPGSSGAPLTSHLNY